MTSAFLPGAFFVPGLQWFKITHIGREGGSDVYSVDREYITFKLYPQSLESGRFYLLYYRVDE